MERTASTLLKTLVTLRWIAIAGQSLTVAIVTGGLGLALQASALWGGIAVLAAFNVLAHWRATRVREPRVAEVLAHIGVDVAVLAWLIAWSGGIANPFASLFLLPIAFAALALPVRATGLVALMCTTGYAVSVVLGQPLPHMHGSLSGFDLHLWGMAANFVVSAAVLLYLFVRMSARLRRGEQELANLRERFARNEGIIALATHAASVAHELNTPLATMTFMLDDLIDDDRDGTLREDHRTLRSLVDVCRDRVHELAAPAGSGADAGAAALVELRRVIERWQLVRPSISLVRHGAIAETTRVDVAVGHLLQTLLNNAADAGEAAGVRRVDLKLEARDGMLHGEIRDYGAGLAEAQMLLPSRMFASGKSHGLGVGLALSHATVERLEGDLYARETEGPGICICFRLPLPAQNPA